MLAQGKEESKKQPPTSSCGLSAKGHTFLPHVPPAYSSPLSSVLLCFLLLPKFSWKTLDLLPMKMVVLDVCVVVPWHQASLGNLLKCDSSRRLSDVLKQRLWGRSLICHQALEPPLSRTLRLRAHLESDVHSYLGQWRENQEERAGGVKDTTGYLQSQLTWTYGSSQKQNHQPKSKPGLDLGILQRCAAWFSCGFPNNWAEAVSNSVACH